MLSEYDMTFIPQKAVKGQALADFLAAHPIPETSELHEDISDEVIEANMTSSDDVWQMFFDGASKTRLKGEIITRVRVVFVSPNDHVLPRAFSLTEPSSDNVAEYNALLISLQLAQWMGVTYLEASGDSKLIFNQIKGEGEVRHEDLIPYLYAAIQLANTFDGLYISHVSHLQNTKADTLADLAATLALPSDTSYHLMVATRHLFCSKFDLEVREVHTTSTHFEPRYLQFLIIDYVLHGILPDDSKEVASIR